MLDQAIHSTGQSTPTGCQVCGLLYWMGYTSECGSRLFGQQSSRVYRSKNQMTSPKPQNRMLDDEYPVYQDTNRPFDHSTNRTNQSLLCYLLLAIHTLVPSPNIPSWHIDHPPDVTSRPNASPTHATRMDVHCFYTFFF